MKVISAKQLPGYEIYTDHGVYERVKMVITLEDGSTRDWWPRILKGTKTSQELADEAMAFVQADLDAAAEVQANMPIERADLDAILVKLKKAGRIESDNWDDLQMEVTNIKAEQL